MAHTFGDFASFFFDPFLAAPVVEEIVVEEFVDPLAAFQPFGFPVVETSFVDFGSFEVAPVIDAGFSDVGFFADPFTAPVTDFGFFADPFAASVVDVGFSDFGFFADPFTVAADDFGFFAEPAFDTFSFAADPVFGATDLAFADPFFGQPASGFLFV